MREWLRCVFKLKDLFRIGNVMLKATPLMAWQWYYIMHTWHDIMLSVGSSGVLYIMIPPMRCQFRPVNDLQVCVEAWWLLCVFWVHSLGSSFLLAFPTSFHPSSSFLGISSLACSELYLVLGIHMGIQLTDFWTKKSLPKNGANKLKMGEKRVEFSHLIWSLIFPESGL